MELLFILVLVATLLHAKRRKKSKKEKKASAETFHDAINEVKVALTTGPSSEGVPGIKCAQSLEPSTGRLWHRAARRTSA